MMMPMRAVSWSFGKAHTLFADIAFTPLLHLCIDLCVYNVQEYREAHCMRNAACNLYLECKKHETS
jgi:hypothetical protein